MVGKVFASVVCSLVPQHQLKTCDYKGPERSRGLTLKYVMTWLRCYNLGLCKKLSDAHEWFCALQIPSNNLLAYQLQAD